MWNGSLTNKTSRRPWLAMSAELSTSAKQPHFVQLVKEVIREED